MNHGPWPCWGAGRRGGGGQGRAGPGCVGLCGRVHHSLRARFAVLMFAPRPWAHTGLYALTPGRAQSRTRLDRLEAPGYFECLGAGQELIKVAIRSSGKPLKRFEARAISLFLAMNRKANENKDDSRHPPNCYFEQFLSGDQGMDGSRSVGFASFYPRLLKSIPFGGIMNR